MTREPLDMDMGDDEQADEIAGYERYIEDPPQDFVIRDHEAEDTGRLGIGAETGMEWTPRRQRREEMETDDRPAEVAAMEIIDDTDL